MQGSLLTTQQKANFLAKLRTGNGNVLKAAKAAGISRTAAYEHKKTDNDFSAAWDEVLEGVADDAEQELYVRAVKGWREPVFHQGEIVGTIRKKSDRLLEFFLKGNRPEKYRERYDINTNVQGSLDVNIEFEIDKIYDATDADGDSDSETAGLAGDAEPDSPG